MADPSWSLARCLELMLEKHCRHLPLLDAAATATGSTKGRADALLSMRDVCRFLAADEDSPPDAGRILISGKSLQASSHTGLHTRLVPLLLLTHYYSRLTICSLRDAHPRRCHQGREALVAARGVRRAKP